MLRCIVGPDGEIVDIRLFLDHVIQDRSKIFALINGKLDRTSRGTLKSQIAVDEIVVDQERRLGADFNPVAEALNFALVVRIRDSGKDSCRIELLNQFT